MQSAFADINGDNGRRQPGSATVTVAHLQVGSQCGPLGRSTLYFGSAVCSRVPAAVVTRIVTNTGVKSTNLA
jgi:hypothetical protein